VHYETSCSHLIKILWWDGVWPQANDGVIALTPAQLAMLAEASTGGCLSVPGGRSWQYRSFLLLCCIFGLERRGGVGDALMRVSAEGAFHAAGRSVNAGWNLIRPALTTGRRAGSRPTVGTPEQSLEASFVLMPVVRQGPAPDENPQAVTNPRIRACRPTSNRPVSYCTSLPRSGAAIDRDGKLRPFLENGHQNVAAIPPNAFRRLRRRLVSRLRADRSA
jgi:hypothetical protein